MINASRNEFGINMDGNCEGCVNEKVGCGGDCITAEAEKKHVCDVLREYGCNGKKVCNCVGCHYRTE